MLSASRTKRGSSGSEPARVRENGGGTSSWNSGRPWLPKEEEELLDLASTQTIATIAKHLSRSEQSVRSKLRNLRFEQHDLAGFKVKDLALMLGVSVRRVRWWREKRYLHGVNGRITEESLERFCKTHPEKIPYRELDGNVRLWLRAYGYRDQEALEGHGL